MPKTPGSETRLPMTPPPAAPNAIARALLAAADSLMYQSKRDGWVHLARARFTDKLEVHGDRRIQAVEPAPPAPAGAGAPADRESSSSTSA